MRRKDREVTDPDYIERIIAQCDCCRLGLCDGDVPYIVPLNFGYARRGDGGYTFYFHGAKEGRKIQLIEKNDRACFEMDTHYALNDGGDVPSAYSARFRSVMGVGRVSLVEDGAEKRAALTALMDHVAGPRTWTFEDARVDGVCVFKLETEELSCKEHL